MNANMQIKVRKINLEAGDTDLILNISDTATILDLKNFIFEKRNITKTNQTLIFKGKQLDDDTLIKDCKIQEDDVIQLLTRPVIGHKVQNINTNNAYSQTFNNFETVGENENQCSSSTEWREYYTSTNNLDVENELKEEEISFNSQIEFPQGVDQELKFSDEEERDYELQTLSTFESKFVETNEEAVEEPIQISSTSQIVVSSYISTAELLKTKSASTSYIQDRRALRKIESQPSTFLDEEQLLDEGNMTAVDSLYFKIGDQVDLQDHIHGAWFEYIITAIRANREHIQQNGKVDESNIVFSGKWEIEFEQADYNVTWGSIRPRARYTYSLNELKVGQVVLVNYNIEEPSKRGYWYDMVIDKIVTQGTKSLTGTLQLGGSKVPIKNCKIKFLNEVMKIEEATPLNDCPGTSYQMNIPLRKSQYFCTKCKDNRKRKCKHCGCFKCGGKNDPSKIILCDRCDKGYHISCLPQQLFVIPDDDWFCPNCKIDKRNVNVKQIKKGKSSGKENNPTQSGSSQFKRHCKSDKNVPDNHFGPIPGVPVGTCWRYRVQVSEAGMHRPPIAAIHGNENEGVYSFVLNGSHVNDIDNGYEFVYTAVDARKKKTKLKKSMSRLNKALALNCKAPLNPVNGAEAKDWKGGKPIRVIRTGKQSKITKYAPKLGNRYDGIYKVIKYYPIENNKNDFKIWRFILRRDDINPAPWEKNCPKLDIIYPPKPLKRKRVLQEQESPLKREKIIFLLRPDIQDLINKDINNNKLWSECKEILEKGKNEFLDKVKMLFNCIYCKMIVKNPVITCCGYNICKDCLIQVSLSKDVSCQSCGQNLKKDQQIKVNENLLKILEELLPDYKN